MPDKEYDPNSLNHALGRIEANLKTMADDHRQNRENNQLALERLGKRVGTLEVFNTTLKAKLAVASAFVSGGVAVTWESAKAIFSSHPK
jgi:uncharacterized alpha-E superfamily protein